MFQKIETEIFKRTQEQNNTFHTPNAQIYGIQTLEDNNFLTVLEGEFADIYYLLNSDETITSLKPYEHFGILTCGWAAPINEENPEDTLPPSQSPDKVRVQLFIVCDAEGSQITSLRFEHTPKKDIIERDKHHGDLGDAIDDLWMQVQYIKNNKETEK